MRDLKKFSGRKIIETIKNGPDKRKKWMLEIFRSAYGNNPGNKYQFWQQDSPTLKLNSNSEIKQKLDYIHNNPIESGIVDKAEAYIYSSARNYTGGKGVIDIELAD